MTERKCSNWLSALTDYVEETESPREFWIWSGIFCISSALQRRVWLPYGMEPLYANLYIMVIAPPGRCRKGSPVGFAKRILSDKGVQIPVFVDSPTKRALTKYLHELSGNSGFSWKPPEGEKRFITQSPLALVSKELSSFLAVDAKSMIEILTDLFDSHDVWEYKTSEKGTDKLYGPCLTCLFASTPSWIASNLPEEAVGGGFTSRFVVVPGFEKYKFVPIPKEGDSGLYKDLITDLARIRQLTGEFIFSSKAQRIFEEWYLTIENKVRSTHDERMHAYLERMHIIALKVAMCLHVAEHDDLILQPDDMTKAIKLVEMVLSNAPKAFGALGRSDTAVLIGELRKQIRITKNVSFKELMRFNYRNVSNRSELKDALGTLEDMGEILINRTYPEGRELMEIQWLERKERDYD